MRTISTTNEDIDDYNFRALDSKLVFLWTDLLHLTELIKRLGKVFYHANDNLLILTHLQNNFYLYNIPES